MREHSTGGRIAVAGLFAAFAGGLLCAPAAAATETPTTVGDTGTTTVPVVVPVDEPETGSSWTLRRTVVDGAPVTVTTTTAGTGSGSLPATTPGTTPGTAPGTTPGTTPGAEFGSVDTGLPDGSSWT